MMVVAIIKLAVLEKIRVVGIGDVDDVSGYLCKDGKGCR